mgnify:CR=1 FL=1
MILIKYINQNAGISFPKYVLPCFCSILAVFMFNSCQQDINIEIETSDKLLLVDGEFTNDSIIHSIKLYSSGSLLTGSPQTVVSGASIYITDQTDTFYYAENESVPGLYQTLGKCCGKGGINYSLFISNIDIDKDGKMDSFIANSMMPVPVKFDSLVSSRGLNGDNNMGVNNWAYYTVKYNGPDYIYKSISLNNQVNYSITDRLGSGEFTRFEPEYKVPKVLNPDSVINYGSYLSITSDVVEGDTISFSCLNFTQNQFEFLKEFDTNTSGDAFQDNMYDQLKIPVNVSTNIEPSDKAAGYFFVYSISTISKVFTE